MEYDTSMTEKYGKWMERFGISVSEAQLKKGIEEDGVDGTNMK